MKVPRRIAAQRARALGALAVGASLLDGSEPLTQEQVNAALDAAAETIGEEQVRSLVRGWLASERLPSAEGNAPTPKASGEARMVLPR